MPTTRTTSILLATILLFTGCISIERHVKDNVFYSSLAPKTKIKIGDGFDFSGNKKDEYFGQYSGGSMWAPPTVKRDRYSFKKQDNVTHSGVKIEIKHYIPTIGLSCYLGAFNSLDIPNALDKGYVTKNPELYYYIYAIDKKSAEDAPATCLLYKTTGRNIGEDVRFTVDYFETLPEEELAKHPCSNWRDKSKLDEGQQKYLTEFERRSQENIVFLDN